MDFFSFTGTTLVLLLKSKIGKFLPSDSNSAEVDATSFEAAVAVVVGALALLAPVFSIFEVKNEVWALWVDESDAAESCNARSFIECSTSGS